MLLPAHSLHITQLLDRTVFGPLKKQMTKEAAGTNRRLGKQRLSKGDFILDLVLARRAAVTTGNITSGFESTGIWPFNPARLILVPETQQPVSPAVPPCRQLQRTPLGSISFENRSFQRRQPLLNTPTKHRLDLMAHSVERLQAKNTLLHKENQELRAGLGTKAKRKPGVGVALFGSHSVLTEQAVAIVAKRRSEQEAKRLSRKRKRKAATPEGDEEVLEEENPFVVQA